MKISIIVLIIALLAPRETKAFSLGGLFSGIQSMGSSMLTHFEAIFTVIDVPHFDVIKRKVTVYSNLKTKMNGGIIYKIPKGKNPIKTEDIEFNLHAYDHNYFGSSGTYLKFYLQQDLLPDKTIQYNQIIKISRFTNLGWRSRTAGPMDIKIKSKGPGLEEFLKNLEIKSGDKKIFYRLEDIKKPISSWYQLVPLAFYLVFFCYFYGILMEQNPETRHPFLASEMNFIIALVVIKQLFIYYFVPTFWIWALFLSVTYNALLDAHDKTPEDWKRSSLSRGYVLVGLILAIISCFEECIFPYLILYSYLGFVIERVLSEEPVEASKIKSVIPNMIAIAFFMNILFIYFNAHNVVFYPFSRKQFCCWFIPGTILLVIDTFFASKRKAILGGNIDNDNEDGEEGEEFFDDEEREDINEL